MSSIEHVSRCLRTQSVIADAKPSSRWVFVTTDFSLTGRPWYKGTYDVVLLQIQTNSCSCSLDMTLEEERWCGCTDLPLIAGVGRFPPGGKHDILRLAAR